MSATLESLRASLASTRQLQSLAHAMKAAAAAHAGQYQAAAAALASYGRTLDLALYAALRRVPARATRPSQGGPSLAIAFGSDQGLAGRFNESMAAFLLRPRQRPPSRTVLWCLGARLRPYLQDAGLRLEEDFSLPGSVPAIAAFVGRLLDGLLRVNPGRVLLYHHRPLPPAAYEPLREVLLPLDKDWRRRRLSPAWPGKQAPETLGPPRRELEAFLREYLYVSLYRACAESLAAENSSRLAAMTRAEKNIGERLEELERGYRNRRQELIDEELRDLQARA